MKITPDFIISMGVCDEALAATIEVFGDGPVDYWPFVEAAKQWVGADDSDGWLKWVDDLRTNPDAIRWWGDAIEENLWQVVCPHTGDKEFDSYEAAVAHRDAMIDNETPQQSELVPVASFDDGVVTDYRPDAGAYIVTNPLTGINATVLAAALGEKLSEVVGEYKISLRAMHSISRRISDPVDGFAAWELCDKVT